MKTICKFPIQIISHQRITMPVGAKILNAGLDPNGTPCIWALVESKESTNEREIFLYGTGHPVSKCDNHIGTFNHGPFVWHVFQ